MDCPGYLDFQKYESLYTKRNKMPLEAPAKHTVRTKRASVALDT